ncbi:MAG: hypothetical protein V3W18_13540 [candidate division Zixibacteria bacterium]
MAKEKSIDMKTIFLTSMFAIIPFTIINQAFSVLNKSLSGRDYISMKNYFAKSQPDYYPVLIMFILFFTVMAIVTVYSIIHTRLPGHWVLRGALIGIVLFLVADLPYAAYTGFTTVIPLSYARGIAIWGLAGNIVNGSLIAYIYMKISDSETRNK